MSSSSLQQALQSGFTALEAGDFSRAEQFCKQVVMGNPKIAAGHFLLGLIALERRERKIAANAFMTTTRLEHSHVGAWAHLAKIFCELGYTSRADEALQKAEQISTEIPSVQNVLGMVNSLIGEHHKAKTWYEKAFKHEANNMVYGVNLANALNFTGDKAAAIETAQNVIEFEPENAQAHWILAGLRRADTSDHGQKMMQFAPKAQTDQFKAFMYYGAGKVFEDVGDWEQAFNAFALGAKAKGASQNYDEAEEEAMFSALQQIGSNYMEQPVQGAPEDFSPIFILGQPRTGTTLIERIMTAHSKVASAGELQQFYLSIRRGAQLHNRTRLSAELMTAAGQLNPAELGKAYQMATRHHQKDGQYFIDKMPTNYLYLPLIAKALPNAKIIHVRRGAMDSCFSSFKQLFADAYPHSYDLETMARHHVRYRKLMDHWRDLLGDRMLEVGYEDTVHDLEPQARRLIEYLGLEWEDACIDFHTQSASVSTASAAQVREPAHTRSVERWKKYESQLEPVKRILTDAGIPL